MQWWEGAQHHNAAAMASISGCPWWQLQYPKCPPWRFELLLLLACIIKQAAAKQLQEYMYLLMAQVYVHWAALAAELLVLRDWQQNVMRKGSGLKKRMRRTNKVC